MAGVGLIATTGVTGGLGGRVARRLADRGARLRLVARDPGRAPELAGAEVVTGSYDDPEGLRRAFQGAQTLFMVSATEDPDRLEQHANVVSAAADAGVERVIYTSIFGAGLACTHTLGRDHWHTEQRIKASGLRHTFLRDNLYIDFLPLLSGSDGVIRGAAADGRVAAVARDDIADVAVAVLLDEHGGHDGRTYDLTGPEALTMAEIAEELSRATGRTITYHAETLEEAYASRAHYGAPDWMVEGWVTTYTAIANGEVAAVSGDVAAVAGAPTDVAGRVPAPQPRQRATPALLAPSVRSYGSTLADSSRTVARSAPSSYAHRSSGAAIGRPTSGSCQVPTGLRYRTQGRERIGNAA